jgi:nucleotide-binding universal stress UspA family protein
MRLLVGVTGDEASKRALLRTLERAQPGDSVTAAVLDEAVDGSTAEVEVTVRRQFAEAGIDPDIVHVEGIPGGGLVELAEGEEYDRVVLGGAKSPMGKIELDRVEEYVLLNSHVTVTIVR